MQHVQYPVLSCAISSFDPINRILKLTVRINLPQRSARAQPKLSPQAQVELKRTFEVTNWRGNSNIFLFLKHDIHHMAIETIDVRKAQYAPLRQSLHPSTNEIIRDLIFFSVRAQYAVNILHLSTHSKSAVFNLLYIV
jgi:hypothetical protein